MHRKNAGIASISLPAAAAVCYPVSLPRVTILCRTPVPAISIKTARLKFPVFDRTEHFGAFHVMFRCVGSYGRNRFLFVKYVFSTSNENLPETMAANKAMSIIKKPCIRYLIKQSINTAAKQTEAVNMMQFFLYSFRSRGLICLCA